jgi:hypothetical protein
MTIIPENDQTDLLTRLDHFQNPRRHKKLGPTGAICCVSRCLGYLSKIPSSSDTARWEKALATGDETTATENLRRFFEQHFHESNDSYVIFGVGLLA